MVIDARWKHLRDAKCRFRHPWGAETRSSRCGEFVFVDEAAEEIAPMHMKILRLRAGCDG